MELLSTDNLTGTRYFLRHYEKGRVVLTGQKDGALISHSYAEGEIVHSDDVQPLFTIPFAMVSEVHNAFSKYFEPKVATKSLSEVAEENKILAAQLEATQNHLDDLRLVMTKLLEKL